MSEGDGVEDALDGALRTSLAVAGRLAEQLMRIREESARRAEASSLQQAREYQAWFDAERAVARAELPPVHEASWWDRTGTADISRAYETATVWSLHDEEARRASDCTYEEVRARYGIDVGNPGADLSAVRVALARVEADRQPVDDERNRADEEQAEAHRLLEHADRVDEISEREHSEPSPARDADELRGSGTPPRAAKRT